MNVSLTKYPTYCSKGDRYGICQRKGHYLVDGSPLCAQHATQRAGAAAVIRAWAMANYDKGGHWIVECMSDAEILEQLKTLAGAKEYVRLVNDKEADAGWGEPTG